MSKINNKPKNLLLKVWTGLVICVVVFPPVRDAIDGVWRGFYFIGNVPFAGEVFIQFLLLEISVVSLVCFVWWKLEEQ